VFKEYYEFGDISPGSTGVFFTRTLTPQPCRVLEVHASGGNSTNFDVEIYDEGKCEAVDKIFSHYSANKEFHDRIPNGFAVLNSEKRNIYFKVSNNDTTNVLRLRLRLVYEV
jgi:hypothetical protein